jgi:hypothetical protein
MIAGSFLDSCLKVTGLFPHFDSFRRLRISLKQVSGTYRPKSPTARRSSRKPVRQRVSAWAFLPSDGCADDFG